LLRDFRDIGLELPDELRASCEVSMQADVMAAAAALRAPFGPESSQRLRDALRLASDLGLRVRLEPVAAVTSAHLLEQARQLLARPDRFAFAAAQALLALADELHLRLDRTEPEEAVYALVERLMAALVAPGVDFPEAALLDTALALAERLNFAVDEFRWRLQVPGGGALPQN
jgi:hypothetical protein